jgi:hypothetical protein
MREVRVALTNRLFLRIPLELAPNEHNDSANDKGFKIDETT